jgi:hypothetical protein
VCKILKIQKNKKISNCLFTHREREREREADFGPQSTGPHSTQENRFFYDVCKILKIQKNKKKYPIVSLLTERERERDFHIYTYIVCKER